MLNNNQESKLISEEDIDQSKLVPIEQTRTIMPSAPASPAQIPTNEATIPLGSGLSTTIKQRPYGGGVPSYELGKIGASGAVGTSAATGTAANEILRSIGPNIVTSLPNGQLASSTTNPNQPRASVHIRLQNIAGSVTAAQEPATTVNSVTNDTNVTGVIVAQDLELGWIGTLAKARGGTGTSTPGLIPGPGISISGSWPDQTVAASGDTAFLDVAQTFTKSQVIEATSGSAVGLTVMAGVSPTADIFDVTDMHGTVLFGVGPTGNTSVSGNLNVIGTYEANGTVGVTAGPFTTISSITTKAGIVTALSGTSDERLKTDIQPFNRGLEAIQAIQPVKFHWNEKGSLQTGLSTEQEFSGFIAQNVQQALPEAITGTEKAKDGSEEYLCLSDRPILAALINAVKELAAENAELRSRISKLESKE